LVLLNTVEKNDRKILKSHNKIITNLVKVIIHFTVAIIDVVAMVLLAKKKKKCVTVVTIEFTFENMM